MDQRNRAQGLPIVQYWHSPEVPSEITKLTTSFRNLNPSSRHVLFDECRARAFIAERFGAREVAAFDACAVPAMQADYFRYCAVFALAGVYADADFRCLRPLDPLIERLPGGTLFRSKFGHLCNGFFVFKRPEHPFLRLALDIATANIERRVGQSVNVVTGPWVFLALEAVHRFGSLEETRRRVSLVSDEKLERIASSVLGAIGGYERVVEAFEDVTIAPLELPNWIGHPDARPAYKQTDLHWVNWQRGRSIFR